MSDQPTQGQISYQFDGLVIGMIVASILDVVTTYYGLTRLPAVEANPVLAPLLKHSFLWLPVYCLIRPLLVPLLPKDTRRTFALFYLVAHLYGTLNNSAMLFLTFSFVNLFGYWIPLGLASFGILALFLYDLIRYPKNRWIMVGWVTGTLAVFFLIEGAFYLLGTYLLS